MKNEKIKKRVMARGGGAHSLVSSPNETDGRVVSTAPSKTACKKLRARKTLVGVFVLLLCLFMALSAACFTLLYNGSNSSSARYAQNSEAVASHAVLTETDEESGTENSAPRAVSLADGETYPQRWTRLIQESVATGEQRTFTLDMGDWEANYNSGTSASFTPYIGGEPGSVAGNAYWLTQGYVATGSNGWGGLAVPAGANIVLDLNGQTLNGKRLMRMDIITVYGTLTVKDSAAPNGKTEPVLDGNGNPVVENNVTKISGQGQIFSNALYEASAIQVNAGGVFNFESGLIRVTQTYILSGSNNVTYDGAGIVVNGSAANKSTLNITGGVVADCPRGGIIAGANTAVSISNAWSVRNGLKGDGYYNAGYGGIFLNACDSITLDNVHVLGNQAGYRNYNGWGYRYAGVSILDYNGSAPAVVKNSIIANNTALALQYAGGMGVSTTKSAEVHIENCVIRNNVNNNTINNSGVAACSGLRIDGNATVKNTLVLNNNGGNHRGDEPVAANGIFVYGGDSEANRFNVSLDNVIVSGNTDVYATSVGALEVDRFVTVNATNCHFGAVTAEENTIDGKAYSGNSSVLSGAVAVAHYGGGNPVLNMNGGSIKGNPGVTAGAIHVAAGGSADLTGVTIAGNSATNTGAIHVVAGVNVSLTQCTVQSNIATGANSVGGIRASGGLTLDGTTVGGTGTLANGSDVANSGTLVGGVYIDSTGTLTLDGATKILGNVSAATPNLYYARTDGTKIAVTGDMSGADIRVRFQLFNGVFTDGFGANNSIKPAAVFSSDKSSEGKIFCIVSDTSTTPYEATTLSADPSERWTLAVKTSYQTANPTQYTAPDGTKYWLGEEVKFTLFEDWNANASGQFNGSLAATAENGYTGTGGLYIPCVTVNGKVVHANIVFDLNGNTLNRGLTAATANGTVLYVDGGTLTVKDSTAPEGGYKPKYDANGNLIITNGLTEIDAPNGKYGKITGGYTNSGTMAGGIAVHNAGTFNFESGVIQNCKNGFSGDGHQQMPTGGVSIGNVYYFDHSISNFNMSGGIIADCAATSSNKNYLSTGGILVFVSNISVTGGYVLHNSTTSTNLAVYHSSAGGIDLFNATNVDIQNLVVQENSGLVGGIRVDLADNSITGWNLNYGVVDKTPSFKNVTLKGNRNNIALNSFAGGMMFFGTHTEATLELDGCNFTGNRLNTSDGNYSTGGYAWASAGLCVYSTEGTIKANVVMKNTTFDNNIAYYGMSTFSATNGAQDFGRIGTLTFENVNVTNTTGARPLFQIPNGIPLTWNGGSISGNTQTGTNPIFRVPTSSTYSLKNVDIQNNTSGGNIVYASSSATLVMEGGSISDNTSTSALVTADGNSTLNMTNCVLRGNTSNSIGGVYVVAGGSATLTQCVVQGNKGTGASGYGGIRADGNLTLDNCTVGYPMGRNTADYANSGSICGGVYVNTAGKLTLTGTTIIANNSSPSGKNNLYYSRTDGTKIAVTGNLHNSEIYFGTPMIGTFTDGFGANNPTIMPTDVFFSDGDFGDGDVLLGKPATPIYNIQNTRTEPYEGVIMGNDNASRWTYAVKTSRENGGAQEPFYLLGDWESNSSGAFNGSVAATTENGYYTGGRLHVPQGVNILFDFNGYKLKRNGAAQDEGMILFVIGTLEIIDSSAKGDDQAPYYDEETGEVTVRGTGVIEGANVNSAGNWGCAILVGAHTNAASAGYRATLKINGGTFRNNTTASSMGAGVITMRCNADVEIKNAYFENNTATGSIATGVIHSWGDSKTNTLSIDHCVFKGNKSTGSYKFDVRAIETKFSMTNCVFDGVGNGASSPLYYQNSNFAAVANIENVRVYDVYQGIRIEQGTAEITNAVIDGASSPGSLRVGGHSSNTVANVKAHGVQVLNSKFSAAYNSSTKKYYAAVDVFIAGSTLEMDSYTDPKTGEVIETKINNNTNTALGISALFVDGGTFKMTGGEISNNNSPAAYEPVAFQNKAVAELTDVNIEGNTSRENTVYLGVTSTLTLTDVNVRGNKTVNSAAIAHVSIEVSSTLVWNGGELSDNTYVSGYALGVDADSRTDSTAELNGVTIDGNTGTGSTSGTIFVNSKNDSLTLDHCAITNNTVSGINLITTASGTASTHAKLFLNETTVDGNTAKNKTFQINVASEFEMKGGSVSNNTVTGTGTNSYWTVSGITLLNNATGRYNPETQTYGVPTLDGVEICENKVAVTNQYSVSGIVSNCPTVINDCVISGNTGGYYGGIKQNTTLHLTLNNTEITDNEGVKSGGIHVTGEVTLNNSRIDNNVSTGTLVSGDKGAAGGIFVDGGAVLNMGAGNSVSGNSTSIPESAGGIYTKSVVNMEGGNIGGNVATGSASAGGVYVYGSKTSVFNMRGGSITLNSAREADGGTVKLGAGGVYVAGTAPTGGVFNVEGNVSINENVLKDGTGKTTSNSDVYVLDGENVRINVTGAFADGARIGLYRKPMGVFTAGFGLHNAGKAAESIFTSNLIISEVKTFDTVREEIIAAANENGEGYTGSYDNAINWAYLVNLSLRTGTQQTFVMYGDWVADENISKTTTFGTDTNAYIAGALNVPKGANMIIELNGSKIDRKLFRANGSGTSDSGAASGYVISVSGELIIRDNHRTDDTLIREGLNDRVNGVEYNGAITGGYNATKNRAGGLYVAAGARVVMEDGRIEENKGSGSAPVSGGVYVDGTFEMLGGSVRNNFGEAAGGVYVSGTGVYTLSAGEIVNNTSTSSTSAPGIGGVRIVKDGTMQFGDGGTELGLIKITDNTLSTGVKSNLKSEDETYQFPVNGTFVAGTLIGITRGSNGKFTVGYGAHNAADPREEKGGYFYSDDENHFVSKQGSGEAMEAVILGYNNRDNWTYAVETSLTFSGATQQFILYTDWTAERPKTTSYTSEFGSNQNAYYHGALYVPAGASIILNLYGHKLSRGLSENEIRVDGFVIYVCGELVIIDEADPSDDSAGVGTITGGASVNMGGAVSVGAGGALTLEGGEIKGNVTSTSSGSASGTAGGVYVYGRNDTRFTMTGGKITGNSGYEAGGVYVDNGVSGDKNGTFTMTGGEISGNTAVSTNVGGVRVNTTGILELGGDAVIKDNSNGEVTGASNLYLMYAKGSLTVMPTLPNIQIVSEFTEDAEIHILRDTIGQFTTGYGEAGNTRKPEDVFKSDNADYFVDEIELTQEDGRKTKEAFMKCLLADVNWSYTVQTSLATKTTQRFTLDKNWIAKSNASYGTSFGTGIGYENGRLYLPVGASVIFDLNGYTVDRNLNSAVQNGEIFFVKGELRIVDSSTAQSGKITGGNSTGTGAIYNSGKLTIEAGEITGNRTTAEKNAAGVYNAGIFTMTGGKITENVGKRGGIYETKSGIINLGGDIVVDGNYNEVTGEDGTEKVPSNLYFEDKTALINVVKPFAAGAKVTLTREGIGVLTTGYGTFNTGNPEDTVFVSDSPNNTYEISHATVNGILEAAIISHDNAINWTHAVKTSLANEGAPQVFTLYGDWTADENHSFGEDVGYLGGALYVPKGANIILDLNGSTIDRGYTEAVSKGYVFDIAGSLTITDSTTEKLGAITGGKSTNTAGGIEIEGSGIVLMQGGTLCGNESGSETDGGAVTAHGKFTQTGGKITENVGAVCGGVYVPKEGTIELGGTAKIEENENADGEVANIYLESKTAKITIVLAFTEGAAFTVARDSIGPVTVGYSALAEGAGVTFESEDPAYLVEKTSDGMELQFITKDNRRNWEYAVQTSLDTGVTQDFKLWSDWDADEEGNFGTEKPYYLNGALNVPVGASVAFNQNGYALNRGLKTAVRNGYVMYVSGELFLDDVSSETDKAGVFTGGNNLTTNSAGGVYVARGATFVMNGGRIAGNGVYAAGGGGVYNNGTFEMNGGVIGAFGNAAAEGTVAYAGNRGLAGGVFNGPYGAFTMTGGSISGNESTENAGGVFIYNSADSVFTMEGGEITNNVAKSAGGIYASGRLVMSGGEISGNVAESTDVTRGGGSGVYVSSTGTFTMTGGVVKENVGLNGIRVYSSGVLNLGGSAQVFHNKNTAVYESTEPHEYRNVYLTIGTQNINIVEAFEEGAYIGVTRDLSGIFTKDYGTYNPDASPAEYFASDKEAYAVSSAHSNVTDTIEGVIGSPVNQPAKTENPVYNGEWQTVLTDYDSRYMSYEKLPLGVIYEESEGEFKALNAGEYTITFHLKDGFCWNDGGNDDLRLTVKILPRVAELGWSHLDDLVYNTREQAPTAYVTNLLDGDICDVDVTGGQIHAGSYTAVASFLSNPNYTLEGAEELEKGYTIERAQIVVTILNDTAAYKTPEELKLSANVSGDGITFITIDNTFVTYTVDDGGLVDADDLSGGMLTVLKSSGTILVTASVQETDDTYAAESEPKEITLTKATPKLALEETVVEYGSETEVVVTGHEELASAGVRLTLENGTGAAKLEGTTLTAEKAGKIKIQITTEETENYFANEATVTVTIAPKVLEIEWDGPFTFDYDGMRHGPEAHATNLLAGDECKVSVGNQQTTAGKYTGENGAHALLVSNPNYTLEGSENVYCDFEIEKVELPLDGVSLLKDRVKYGEVLTLAITGNKENAEVLYEIVYDEIPDPNRTYGDGEIYYGIKEAETEEDEDEKLYDPADREDLEKAYFNPLQVGSVRVKVTVLESENYTGCVHYQYVEIDRASLEATFYTDVEKEIREVTYGDENVDLFVVGNPESGAVTFEVLGGTGEVQIANGVLKALKAGQVNVWMHIDATAHYDAMDVTEIITVKPRPVVVNWTEAELIYNGAEQAPAATIGTVFGDVVEVVVTGAVNAGKHTATAVALTGTNSENYTLDEAQGALLTSTEFEIQPRKIESVTWGGKTLPFTGEYQAPSYTLVGLIAPDTCEFEIEGMGLHVGKYTATVVGSKNPNYFVDDSTENRSVEYEIYKVNITLEILNESVRYYNETKIELSGNIGGGAEHYAITTRPEGIATVSEDGVISAFADELGGYVTISVEVDETEDTYAGTVTKTVPIVKSEGELEFTETEVVYGDKLTLEFTSEWHAEDVSLTLVNGTDEAGMGTARFDRETLELTGLGAGEVQIIVRTMETDKYLATDKRITIVILQRELVVEWQDEFEYDGKEKLPVAENIENLAFNDDAPEIGLGGAQTEVGEYVANVTGISNPNYTLASDEVPFVIKKAAFEIEVTPAEILVNEENVPIEIKNNLSGEDYELELADGTGTARLEMIDDEGNHFYITTSATGHNGNFFITPTSAGEVVLIVRIPETENYLGFEGQFTIKIKHLEAEIDLANKEVSYGETLGLELVGEGVEGRTATYAVENGTGTAELTADGLLGTGVGTVTLTVTLAANELYDEQTFSVTITVKSRPVELSWEIGEYTYDGTEHTPEATVANTVFDDEVNVTVKGNVNAGTNLTAAAIALDNPNYTLVGGKDITAQYVIERKVVEVEWDADTFTFVYDGEKHAPKASVKDGFLVGDDECEVNVSGAQTDAYDSWEARVASLSNPNYTVDQESENSSVTFEITTADPEVTLNEVELRYHETSELSVTCVPKSGKVTYTIIDGTDNAEIRGGNKIYGKQLGEITLQIDVASLPSSAGGEWLNTTPATITVKLTTLKGWQPYQLEKNTVVYGDTLELSLTEFDEEADYTFLSVSDGEDGGKAELNGNVLTPNHVGTVLVKVEYAETAHYEKTVRELEVTITPRVIEFVWDNDPADEKLTFTYNGVEQAPKAIAQGLLGDDECGIAVKGARDAGNHTATAQGTTNPNYTITGSESMKNHPKQDFVIHQLAVEVEWNETTLEYNAKPQTPTAEIVNKFMGNEKYAEDEVSFVYEGYQTELGFYTDDERAKIVGLTGKDAKNYTLDGVAAETLETDFEIVKGHLHLQLSVSSDSIRYLQTTNVKLEGYIGGGEITYEVTGPGEIITNEDGTVVLKATGVGTVTVQVHVAETEKTYAADSNKVTVKVAKAIWDAQFTCDATYGMKSPMVWKTPGMIPSIGLNYYYPYYYNVPNNDRGGSVLSYYSFTPYGVGTYRFYLSWSENDLFESSNGYVVRYITVKRKALTIDWDKLEFTYDGKAKTPVVTTHTQVAVKGDKFPVRFSGVGTDAGSYIVTAVGLDGEARGQWGYTFNGDTYYYLTGDNLASSYTIGRSEIDPKIITTDAEYGVPLQLQLQGNLGNGKVTYEILPGGTGTATLGGENGDILSPTRLGTIIVKAYVEETKNYHAGECTAIITIGKRIPQLNLDKNTVVYGDDLQLNVLGNEEHGQLLFSVEDGTGSATITPASGILTPVRVGKVKVIISITETTSYRAYRVEREVTITPRPVEIEWDEDTLEFEYDGTLKTPVAKIVGGVVNGDEVKVNVVGGKINAGVYVATAQGCTNPNYTVDSKAENRETQFVITPLTVEIQIEQTEAYLGVPVTLTVSSNLPIDQGKVRYEVTSAGGDATLEGNVITGTQAGEVIVKATLPASTNYRAATDMRTFEVKKYVPNIGLKETEVIYGDYLELEATGLGEGGKVLSYAVEGKTGNGTIESGSTRLRGTGAGTVIVKVTVSATANYDGGTFDVEVTVLPRPVALQWFGEYNEQNVFTFMYNGEEQYPEARVVNAIGGDAGRVNVTLAQGAVNAGEHYAKAVELDNKNYTLEGGQNVENIPMKISPIVAELEWEDGTYVYDSRMQAPEAKVTNLIAADEGKVRVKVSGETHATKTWEGEVATAMATLIDSPNYTLIGCESLTTTYVIEQKEAKLKWDDVEGIEYNGGQTELPGATVDNKYDGDECNVLVRKYEPPKLLSRMGAPMKRDGTVSNTLIAEAYGFEGANEDDYKLPEDNTMEVPLEAKELRLTFPKGLEVTYNGEVQYPEYELSGKSAGDDVRLEFECAEDPIDVKYKADNRTIDSYVVKIKLAGASAHLYKVDSLYMKPDGKGGLEPRFEFKIMPLAVTVKAASKNVQIMLEGDEVTDFVLDKFHTKDWKDWFDLTCDELVGKDAGAGMDEIFRMEDYFLEPAFYRITRNEEGKIVSISDKRVVPGGEGEDGDIGLGEFKIGFVDEKRPELACKTGNYVATVELIGEPYGILSVVSDNDVIKLDFIKSGYQFLYLEKVSEYEMYRRAYAELGWTHGEEDAEFERVVLGQVQPNTTANIFLGYFEEAQIKQLRITSSDGATVIYDRGTLYDEAAYLGTGAKVELMQGEAAIDTVYISVLGDVNGDGLLTTADSSTVNSYIATYIPESVDIIENKLSALVFNNGGVSTLDSSLINQAIAESTNLERYFYHEENS